MKYKCFKVSRIHYGPWGNAVQRRRGIAKSAPGQTFLAENSGRGRGIRWLDVDVENAENAPCSLLSAVGQDGDVRSELWHVAAHSLHFYKSLMSQFVSESWCLGFHVSNLALPHVRHQCRSQGVLQRSHCNLAKSKVALTDQAHRTHQYHNWVIRYDYFMLFRSQGSCMISWQKNQDYLSGAVDACCICKMMTSNQCFVLLDAVFMRRSWKHGRP